MVIKAHEIPCFGSILRVFPMQSRKNQHIFLVEAIDCTHLLLNPTLNRSVTDSQSIIQSNMILDYRHFELK